MVVPQKRAQQQQQQQQGEEEEEEEEQAVQNDVGLVVLVVVAAAAICSRPDPESLWGFRCMQALVCSLVGLAVSPTRNKIQRDWKPRG